MTEQATPEYCYVLRNCKEGGVSHNGFVWPQSGPVEAPDWNPEPVCGGGLHGWLGAMGDMALGHGEDAPVWVVVKVDRALIVELGGKVKFPRGEVVYYGSVDGAVAHLASVGVCGYRGTSTSGTRGTSTSGTRGTSTSGTRGTSTSGYGGTSTSGDGGTSTSGTRGTSTSGSRGTSTSGYGGTSTSGDGGTSTSGYGGRARAGERGEIHLLWWDTVRGSYRTVIGYVGEEGIESDVYYRLDDQHRIVRAEVQS
jgi:hypothetical protein